jgi:hypothetical protein
MNLGVPDYQQSALSPATPQRTIICTRVPVLSSLSHLAARSTSFLLGGLCTAPLLPGVRSSGVFLIGLTCVRGRLHYGVAGRGQQSGYGWVVAGGLTPSGFYGYAIEI